MAYFSENITSRYPHKRMKQNPFSIRTRFKSFRYAIEGIRTMVCQEHNARVHLVALCLVLIAAYCFDLSTLEWIAVLFAAGFVVTAEAFNAAIERLADRITSEQDPMICQAKDLAAGAVLLASITAALVGILIFIPKIYRFLI